MAALSSSFDRPTLCEHTMSLPSKRLAITWSSRWFPSMCQPVVKWFNNHSCALGLLRVEGSRSHTTCHYLIDSPLSLLSSLVGAQHQPAFMDSSNITGQSFSKRLPISLFGMSLFGMLSIWDVLQILCLGFGFVTYTASQMMRRNQHLRSSVSESEGKGNCRIWDSSNVTVKLLLVRIESQLSS